MDAGASPGCECGGKPPAYLVGRENERFHFDVVLGAFDGADHRVVELVPLGKELEGAMPFVEGWHAKPRAFASNLHLRAAGAGSATAVAVRRARPSVSVRHSFRPCEHPVSSIRTKPHAPVRNERERRRG